MKKYILLFTLFLGSLGFAQQEIKIDIADALVIRSLEFSYEKYLTDESSIGISALFNLAKEDVTFRYNENMMITPYYRHYFSTDKQWNFFGEGFMGINSGNYRGKYTDGALGLAIGTKYIASGGLVIDFYSGLGRNLFSSNSPVLVPRAGLNIGWRF